MLNTKKKEMQRTGHVTKSSQIKDTINSYPQEALKAYRDGMKEKATYAMIILLGLKKCFFPWYGALHTWGR